MAIKMEGIYVPLDVLLDTRIGTVACLLGDDKALEVLQQGYHSRQDDKFPGVDVDAYKRLYSARNMETLKASTLTNAVEIIAKTIVALLEQAIEGPYRVGIRVVVNTHPYQVSAEESASITNVIAGKLKMLAQVGVPIEVETLSLPLSALTPGYCKDNFKALLMYEFEEWLGLQHRALMQQAIPEITLITPAIYHEKTPTLSELKETIDEIAHPFYVLYESLKPFIRLELIDVSYFSIVNLNPTA